MGSSVSLCRRLMCSRILLHGSGGINAAHESARCRAHAYTSFQLLAIKFRRTPKQWFGLQRSPTSPSILGQPTVHRRTIDTDNASYHFWTFAVLNTADRALAHRLQSAVVKASGIVRLHDSRESYSLHPVKGSLSTYEQINTFPRMFFSSARRF